MQLKKKKTCIGCTASLANPVPHLRITVDTETARRVANKVRQPTPGRYNPTSPTNFAASIPYSPASSLNCTGSDFHPESRHRTFHLVRNPPFGRRPRVSPECLRRRHHQRESTPPSLPQVGRSKK
ncbi:hypothetical protein ECG_09362 [Echinococcus granulosus]|nr:hypothetical protein ECG_09362 [Echinococcus granulosus]